MGRSYATDYAIVALMSRYPPRFIESFVKNPDPATMRAASEVDTDFVFRANPMFLDQLPPRFKSEILRRLTDAGVERYRPEDWAEYERFRRILLSLGPGTDGA